MGKDIQKAFKRGNLYRGREFASDDSAKEPTKDLMARAKFRQEGFGLGVVWIVLQDTHTNIVKLNEDLHVPIHHQSRGVVSWCCPTESRRVFGAKYFSPVERLEVTKNLCGFL